MLLLLLLLGRYAMNYGRIDRFSTVAAVAVVMIFFSSSQTEPKWFWIRLGNEGSHEQQQLLLLPHAYMCAIIKKFPLNLWRLNAKYANAS